MKNQKSALSQKLLAFHQKNYLELGLHQSILNPKHSYFQYSRYFAILQEIKPIGLSSFLDVGCAEGMYLVAVKSLFKNSNVFGVDFSSVALRKARSFTSQLCASLMVSDVKELPFRDEEFDVVLCSETLEHVVEDKLAIKELARVSKKACIITVPSFNNQRSKRSFKPDVDCTFDSHLRKYLKVDLVEILSENFCRVEIFNLSEWYLSTLDIVLHTYLPKRLAGEISLVFSKLVRIDHYLCKAGAHGHSFICICFNK